MKSSITSNSQKNIMKENVLQEIFKLVENMDKTIPEKSEKKDFHFGRLNQKDKELYHKIKNSVRKKENRNQGYQNKFAKLEVEDFVNRTLLKSNITNEFMDEAYISPSVANFTNNNKALPVNVDTYNIKKDLKFDNEDYIKIELEQKASPPELSCDLIQVVKQPGIYPLSSIKALTSSSLHLLEKLPTPEEIHLDRLDTYMKPHDDPNLKKLMSQHKLKYSSSTSGISETLAHFFYKLTNFKSPHFYNLSESYVNEPLRFMMFQRKPSSIVLLKNPNGTYGINNNSVFETREEFILLKMGKYMEKLFTSQPEEFEAKYLKSKSISTDEVNQVMEKEVDYFKFIRYGKILLRSQIDCGGKDKNGNDIVFEIKTRAVAPIRYDVHNYLDYLDYDLNSLHGKHSSYEREFYDLIRGAFLKYLFQLKIGGMNGALISYHNTQRIYGFEYITLADMERRILGNSNFSDVIFKASLKLLQETLDKIVEDFPNEDQLHIGFFANEWKGTLDVFVEIVNQDTYKNFDATKYKEVIDYFYITGYRPKVHKYTIIATPILNDVITTFSPILYENNDNYSVKYQIIYNGNPSFDEYMQFIHETYHQKDNTNIQTQFTGSWSSTYEK